MNNVSGIIAVTRAAPTHVRLMSEFYNNVRCRSEWLCLLSAAGRESHSFLLLNTCIITRQLKQQARVKTARLMCALTHAAQQPRL